jgi:hypothetical protein
MATARTEVSVTGTLEQALDHAARLLDRDPTLAVEQLTEILKVAEEIQPRCNCWQRHGQFGTGTPADLPGGSGSLATLRGMAGASGVGVGAAAAELSGRA